MNLMNSSRKTIDFPVIAAEVVSFAVVAVVAPDYIALLVATVGGHETVVDAPLETMM